MPTKKKAVKAKAAEPVVVEIKAVGLKAWATEAVGIVKTYRAGATSGSVRTALDDLIVRLRVLIGECGVK